jgi:hypothetical protein
VSPGFDGKQELALRQIVDRSLRLLSHLLPRNAAVDRAYHLLLFCWKHGRLPRRGAKMWNDMWYRVKTSDELLDPLRVFVTDKEFVKSYVSQKAGDRYVVPTLALLRRADEVDEFPFPPDCCIKPTHASGELVLRRGEQLVDRQRIKKWFSLNYYLKGREPNYLRLMPKVIVEPLIFDSDAVDDYKIFCFEGCPRIIQVDLDRFSGHKRKFFDTAWNELDFSIIYPRATREIRRPDTLDEMLAVARALSQEFQLVRIDQYTNNQRVLVGEITLCPDNAGGIFLPRCAERDASELMVTGVVRKGRTLALAL